MSSVKLRHGSLFSGIGGFDLAAEWAGWQNVFHCEWNPFGQRVLKHYWPNAESFNDITKSDFSKYEHTIDIISGGFPCQPFSTAGQRRGAEDTRYLWPAMLDVIRTVKPRYVVGENVHGLVNWNNGLVFDTVCADLEAEGYEVQAFLLPAAAVGALHKRDRIWFVAYSNKIPRECMDERRTKSVLQRKKSKWSESRQLLQLVFNGTMAEVRTNEGQYITSEPALVSSFDGFSYDLAGGTIQKYADEANGAYGNAIVPQVALQIFKAINEYEIQELKTK